MDKFDRTWQGTEPLLFSTWNLTQLYVQKVHFLQLAVFALVWSHVGIEIPYPAPLLANPASQPPKNSFPAPTRNWNSRFAPVFSAQIPNITAKNSQIPHPAKPIGNPQLGQTSVANSKSSFSFSVKLSHVLIDRLADSHRSFIQIFVSVERVLARAFRDFIQVACIQYWPGATLNYIL